MSHFDDDALLKYRFDTLGRDQVLELSEHLRRCAECTARYADLCRQVEGLNQYAAEPVDPEGQLRRALDSVTERHTAPEPPKARKITPYPGTRPPVPPSPELEPEPDTGASRMPLLQWLGVRPGAPGRPARLLAAAAMFLATVYVGGGTAYYASAQVRVDTQISTERGWLAGGEATAAVKVLSVAGRKPVEGVEVELALQCGGQRYPLAKARTDAGGTASPTFVVPPDADGACVLEARSSALGERDTAQVHLGVARQFRVHLGTDKPLYQPGQTIHVRALALQHPSQAPAAGQTLELQVKDPKGNRLTLEQRMLGKFGVGSMSFELADDVPLGEYTVVATLGGASESVAVKVDRYALPKFNVTVAPEKDAYLAGETLRATVNARYFFGKPVARAEVHALLVRSNGEVIGQEIVGRTTDEGELRVQAELPDALAASGGESVFLQAQVKDAAGQEERKEQSVAVSRDTLQVDVLFAGPNLGLDQENDLFVLTSTPDGRPVSASVELVDRTGSQTLHANTGARGVALVRVRPARQPVYDVTAETIDGRRVTRTIPLGAARRALGLSLDRALYKPGETVKAQVEIGTTFGVSWVELEGVRDGQVILHQEATVQGDKATFELALPPTLTGSLELVARPLAEGPSDGSWTVSRWIAVAEPRALSVAITPDQPEYRPGSDMKLRFEVKDAQGRPSAASLGVTVVDESLFARTADLPQQARAAFLLEHGMLATTRGISAADVLSSSDWTSEEQAAAAALFSLSGGRGRSPDRQQEGTLQAKQQRLDQAKELFEGRARLTGLLAGVLLTLAALGALLRVRMSSPAQVVTAAIAGAACWLTFGAPWLAGAVFFGALVAAARQAGASSSMYRSLKGLGAAAVVLLAVVGALALLMQRKSLSPREKAELLATGYAHGEQSVQKLKQRYPGSEGEAGRANAGLGVGIGGLGGAQQKKAMPSSAPSAPSPMAKMKGAGMADMMEAVDRLGKAGGVLAAPPAPPRRIARVREYFPETMFVHPELIADERGVAELTIPVADSITAWRVSAFASSASGKIGSAQAPLKVFQDFFVDVDAPPALVQGDEAEIPVAVYNYLSDRQTVRLEVQREEWFELVGPQTMSLQIAPGGLEGKPLRIRALKPGKHKLTLRADGTRTSDAVARELLVSERGHLVVDAFSGEVSKDSPARRSVVVPDQVATSLLTLKLYPTRTAVALDGLEGSLRAPHGCFEQTSSSHYPNVLIYESLKRSGRLTPETEKRARALISDGYQRLLSFEVQGGGFEWFGRAPANQVLTAYGLLELSDMSHLFPVDPQVIARTQRYLEQRQTADGSWAPDAASLSDGLWRSEYAGRVTVTAYVAWALAESGVRGNSLGRALNYLARHLDQTDDAYTDALATAAFAKVGHPSAAFATRRLVARAVREEQRARFSPAAATAYYGRGKGGMVETTALAAQALHNAAVEEQLQEGSLQYLLFSRLGSGAWPSTQATILALRALLQGAEPEQDATVRVKVNGADAGTFTLKSSSNEATVIELSVKAKRGQNVVEVESDRRAGYQLLSTYVLPWRQRGDEEKEPLSLDVAYGRTSVRVGEVVPVTVKLTYRRPDASGMAMVQFGLAAGLAPVFDDLEGLRVAGRVARYESDARTVNLYLDRLTEGAPVQLSFRLKAKGRVRTSGVESRAYLYYAPEISAAAPPVAMAVN